MIERFLIIIDKLSNNKPKEEELTKKSGYK